MSKMFKTRDRSLSSIEEIENQISDLMSRKKEEVEKELEEKIRIEREEAQKKMESVEKEFKEEKESITKYRVMIAEFEKNKTDLKDQIREHLNMAVQLQTEIDTMTGRTLKELRIVNELSHKLEQLNQEVEEKTYLLKKDLKEKSGVAGKISEQERSSIESADFEQDLKKLNKVKELLETMDVDPNGRSKAKEELEGVVKVYEEGAFLEPNSEMVREGSIQGEKEKTEILEEKGAEKDDFEILRKYRMAELINDTDEVCYYENKGKIILDSESIVSALCRHLEEVKKLYIKLSQVESVKDQYYVKREITRYQEVLQKIFLESLKMLQKESCKLPEYTSDILNMDVLKEILGKLTVEKWTDQEKFTSFDEYAKKVKKDYYERLSSPNGYLRSVLQGLGIRHN